MSHTEPSPSVVLAMTLLLHELAVLLEHLDAVVRAVAHVDEPVVRQLGAVHRVAELLGGRRVGVVVAEVRVVGLVAVGAPVALDLAGVRRRSRPRACCRSRRRRRPRSPSGRRRSWPRGRSSPVSLLPAALARGAPNCSRNLPSCVNFRMWASLGVVAADPDVALVVDGDAVVRRRPLVALAGPAPAADQVAGGIELEHRRRGAGSTRRRGERSRRRPISVRALSVLPPRWMIHTWSRASTRQPMVEPRSQWLGSGLGQSGSTSKRGACTRACASAAAVVSSIRLAGGQGHEECQESPHRHRRRTCASDVPFVRPSSRVSEVRGFAPTRGKAPVYMDTVPSKSPVKS